MEKFVRDVMTEAFTELLSEYFAYDAKIESEYLGFEEVYEVFWRMIDSEFDLPSYRPSDTVLHNWYEIILQFKPKYFMNYNACFYDAVETVQKLIQYEIEIAKDENHFFEAIDEYSIGNENIVIIKDCSIPYYEIDLEDLLGCNYNFIVQKEKYSDSWLIRRTDVRRLYPYFWEACTPDEIEDMVGVYAEVSEISGILRVNSIVDALDVINYLIQL